MGYVYGETPHWVMKQHKIFLNGFLCDGIENVTNFIKKLHTESKAFLTYNDIQEYIFLSRFRKSLLPDTVRHLFRIKLQNEFNSVPEEPMEQKRINAKLKNCEQNLYLLSQKINGIPLAFILNLDRIGYEEFANAHEITVIVLANYQKATASYYSASFIKSNTNVRSCNISFTQNKLEKRKTVCN